VSGNNFGANNMYEAGQKSVNTASNPFDLGLFSREKEIWSSGAVGISKMNKRTVVNLVGSNVSANLLSVKIKALPHQ
jgi:hypothetical protein